MPVLNTLDGEEGHWTWESTHGIRHRIDYVLSCSWLANHALSSDALHCLDRVNHLTGHIPITMSFKWQASLTRRIASQKRLGPEAFKGTEKAAAFKQGPKEIPRVPRGAPPSDHHATINSGVAKAAVEAVGVAPRRA
eukprot:9057583-Pyramimonas_sp.AAC.1